MAATIREQDDRDLPALYDLYMDILDTCPGIDLVPSRQQFCNHLKRPRLYAQEDWFDPKADIALVAENEGRIIAYANGRLLRKGDFLLADNTAIIQWALGGRQDRPVITAVLAEVLKHLQAFNPTGVHAFNGMTTPVFSGNLGGGLPSAWPWIGQCLEDAGFTADAPSVLMWCDLSNRDTTLPPVPDGFELKVGQTFVNDHCAGLESEQNKGIYLMDGDEFAGWCGSFFSGAFVEGSDRDYLYTHWFTVSEPYRGLGLGRFLLRYALADGRSNGARGALLLTDVNNFHALNLYRSEGYRPVALSHGFALKQEDQIDVD